MTTDSRTCPTCSTPLPAEAHFCLHCGTATPTEPGVPQRTAPTGTFEVSRVRTALADRYKIEKVLGEGGMATVYVAEDLKHKRKVAVKVMRPELAETLGTERFLREVEIAARLSHPNILPVHDSGNAGGILYYVMPLVEGESLPDRLRREKQLPVGEALRLAREVAEALAYAHAQGIVHRDIKPANILISAGHALVADFGIARATSGGGPALTQTGLAIGTPQYMSPEQASGDANIDGRTDIYALGCVLYEMIAGEPPFTGPTAQVIISRSITEAPRPLEQTRTALPAVVGSAVMRALAKTPADRYATGTEMATALSNAEDMARTSGTTAVAAAPGKSWTRWAVAAVAAIVLGVAGYKYFTAGPAVPLAKSVAVLAFENQGSADEAYFADGLVDELRDKLAKLKQLTVIASASSDQFKGTEKTSIEIAEALRVDQLLMGKVRWADDPAGGRQVKVTTELVDGKTGAVTWRDTFEAPMTDAFSIEGQIATRVAVALGAVLGKAESDAMATTLTKSPEAYDLYLKGNAASGPSATSARIASGYFEQAVALDSNFAFAWGRLTGSLGTLYANGTRDPAVGRRAKEAMLRMLSLADTVAAAHIVAANYYTNVERDVISAEREIARAYELNPKDAWVLQNSAGVDLRAERYEAAFDKLSKAREISPLSAGVLTSLIEAQLALGRLDEAKIAGDELVALEPKGPQIIGTAFSVPLARGDLDGAKQVLRDFIKRGVLSQTEIVAYFAGYEERTYLFDKAELELLFRLTPAAFDNDRAWWGQSLAIAAMQQGDRVRAKAYADSALAISKQQSDANPTDPQLRALYAVMLAYVGRTDEAITEVNRAVEDGNGQTTRNSSYERLQRVRVYMAAGKPDLAIDGIQELMGRQNYLTVGMLKVDPTFAPLKDNPRFKKLLVGGMKAPLDG